MSRREPFVVHEEDCPVEGADDGAFGPVHWRTLLSGDRSPTDALTLGVATLATGGPERPRLHAHAHPEAYYILSGEGVVHIAGAEHALRAGTAVYIPGGAVHGARNTGTEPLRLLYVFPADSFDEIQYEFPEASPEGPG